MLDAMPPGTPVQVKIRQDDDPPVIEMTGRHTGIPGLVANRAPDRECEELWGVTHYRSGLGLGFWTEDPELAIRFAHEIGKLADWTLHGDAIVRLKLGPAVTEIGHRLGMEMIGDTRTSSDRDDLKGNHDDHDRPTR